MYTVCLNSTEVFQYSWREFSEKYYTFTKPMKIVCVGDESVPPPHPLKGIDREKIIIVKNLPFLGTN